jgi:hypothetical protein
VARNASAPLRAQAEQAGAGASRAAIAGIEHVWDIVYHSSRLLIPGWRSPCSYDP